MQRIHQGISVHWPLNCFFESLFSLTTKKSSKLYIIDPSCRETTGDWQIPLTKGQQCCFHAISWHTVSWTKMALWLRAFPKKKFIASFPRKGQAILAAIGWTTIQGHFKNTYELLNLRALKNKFLYKNQIFQSMSKIFWVEFQRFPLKFHTKYLTHTLKDDPFIKC